MAIFQIPVVKAKTTVPIDTDVIPPDVYAEALKLGLKELVNRGMSKITKAAFPDEAELKAKALEQAEKNVEAINSGKIRFASGTATKKASGAVMTEARRLAKEVIKDMMKKNGLKIAHVNASEITKAANALLASEQGKSYIEAAEAEIKRREEAKAQIEGTPDTPLASILAGIAINPTKKAKAEEAKAKRKASAKPSAAGQLSAKQAGKVAPRAKPQPQVGA